MRPIGSLARRLSKLFDGLRARSAGELAAADDRESLGERELRRKQSRPSERRAMMDGRGQKVTHLREVPRRPFVAPTERFARLSELLVARARACHSLPEADDNNRNRNGRPAIPTASAGAVDVDATRQTGSRALGTHLHFRQPAGRRQRRRQTDTIAERRSTRSGKAEILAATRERHD